MTSRTYDTNSFFLGVANAQLERGFDEIFIPGGSVRLKWDGFKYTFNIDINNPCVGNSTLYEVLWSDKKDGIKNCYEESSEKFILFNKLINSNGSNLLQAIRKSDKIAESRKKEILNLISRNKKLATHEISLDLKKTEFKKKYSNSFNNKNVNLASLIDRVNILLLSGNSIGATKVIRKIFEMKKEQLILHMNHVYLRSDKYLELFSYFEDFKKEIQFSNKKIESKEVKKYFQLFLDNDALLKGFNSFDFENKKFFIHGLDCDPQASSNLVLFRSCLVDKIDDGIGSDLIVYVLRKLGDDSLDNLWRIK